MDYSWFTADWAKMLTVFISTVGIYIALIVYTRIAGLRSFSKISSFDFGITVAIGAVLASVILSSSLSLLVGFVALGGLYAVQMAVAYLRSQSSRVSSLVDNDPLILMNGTNVLFDNLKKARVTHDDLRGKLREANVTQLSQVKAVVMETTGDISVLHHEDPNHELEDELLQGVRGYDA